MRVEGKRRYEKGITSLIVVLFTTLLFVVVTVGFMQTMTVEQRASADDELSRGAYDSALAGVEDGKRVLQACLAGDAGSCTAIGNSATRKCTTVSDAGFVNAQPNGEVYLKSVSGGSLTGKEYQQAYTCVKIALDTNYKGTATEDQAIIIPLRTISRIDSLHIYWFMRQNSTSDTINLDPPLAPMTLPNKSSWPSDRPSVLRLQLMQFSSGNMNLDSFDQNGNGHTLYLYPKSINSFPSFANDARRSGSLLPMAAHCAASFLGPYACEAVVSLPNPIGGSADTRVAYLRLSSLYNSADFLIQPEYAGSDVMFNLVQPSIDSTGRAGDVFRRVDASVELTDPNDSMLYPRATVDTTGNFCKAFAVTDDPAEYQDSCNIP